MATDDLTAALDEIRQHARALEHLRLNGIDVELGKAVVLLTAAADVPRLLAAVEAVLALAQGLTLPPGRATASGLYGAAYEDAERQVGTVLREAISRALLGEDGTDG